MKRFEENLETAKAITQATQGQPGTEMGEATLQLVLTKLLDELRCIEDFRDMDSEQVILAVARVSRAIAAVSRLKLDYEKGYRAGCFKAAEEADKAARQEGAGEGLMTKIRAAIMGLSNGAA
jgi:hypothetical protein